MSSYGTSTYGTSGYNSRSPSRYDTSNYGTTSYGMRTGVHGTAGYGSTGSRDFAVGGYAPSSKSRGEVFQSSRYGPRCKRYNIPWQESVARVWGFPPQSGDIGTQDYCQPGEGKTGPIWQGRRRSMQRLPQSRTRLAYDGSGLQGSGFTTYGREMIRSGAVPHYEWGKYSSGMRQIAEQRRTQENPIPAALWNSSPAAVSDRHRSVQVQDGRHRPCTESPQGVCGSSMEATRASTASLTAQLSS